MKCKIDLSGIDSLLCKRTQAKIIQARIQAGKDGVRYARQIGSYQDRTKNLRNANGFCVVSNGRIVALEVDNDGTHPKAKENTINLLTYSEKPHDGLYLANGMPYASFVENKGKEVIKTAGLYATKILRKQLKQK